MAVVPGEMRNRLHIATVHWQRPDWIEPQLRYLRRFAPPDTKVWASLDGIDQEHGAGFDYTTTLEGRHADKLNELAHRISREADPGDQLLFLDGDAFPIAPLAPLLAAPDRLIAVRRDEKDEKQPHPCFALTSVGFWNEINGDWSHGYVSDGGHIDVGGELLRSLSERGLRWRALTRLNTVNLHPLWFAIYGDHDAGPAVYHHGAGFRARVDRTDRVPRPALIPAGVPVLGRAERSLRWRWRHRGAYVPRAGAKPEEQVRSWIAADDNIAERFMV